MIGCLECINICIKKERKSVKIFITIFGQNNVILGSSFNTFGISDYINLGRRKHWVSKLTK